MRSAGLAHASVVKPEYPRYYTGAGEGLRPFDPQERRATEGSAILKQTQRALKGAQDQRTPSGRRFTTT